MQKWWQGLKQDICKELCPHKQMVYAQSVHKYHRGNEMGELWVGNLELLRRKCRVFRERQDKGS